MSAYKLLLNGFGDVCFNKFQYLKIWPSFGLYRKLVECFFMCSSWGPQRRLHIWATSWVWNIVWKRWKVPKKWILTSVS